MRYLTKTNILIAVFVLYVIAHFFYHQYEHMMVKGMIRSLQDASNENAYVDDNEEES